MTGNFRYVALVVFKKKIELGSKNRPKVFFLNNFFPMEFISIESDGMCTEFNCESIDI